MKMFRTHMGAMVVVTACLCYGAQVGVLLEKSTAMFQTPVKGFKTVVSDVLVLDMNKDAAMGKAHCQKMKAQGCKVIVAVGKKAAKAAMRSGLPVVYCMVMTPADDGIKGSKVTGVSLDIPMVKQFKAFKSAVPSLKKVGLAYSDDTSSKLAREMRRAAGKTGLTLVEKKVSSDSEVPNAIRNLKGQIDGLYLPPDRTVAKRDAFQFIALFTFDNNLPFMAPTSRFVKKGALIALMIDYEEVGKQTAGMVKKILAGTPVSSLAPQPPQATILVLNQKTAQTIGINIPPDLLKGSEIIK